MRFVESRIDTTDQSCYVIAEIGINHNGSLETAKQLIDVARDSRCQAVKLQKRTPEISTPKEMRDVLRETPWGLMTYLDYKKKIEFGTQEYEELSSYANALGLDFFASSWDLQSLAFMEELGVPVHKIASASLTDHTLLEAHAKTGKPVIMSTGMSTIEEIEEAVAIIPRDKLVLLHSTSSYPLNPAEANLRMISTLEDKFQVPVGYSGHETGLQVSIAAVTLGAKVIERHITLSRSMWGSDHAASLEPQGIARLVRDIRIVESALGDGEKRVYKSEIPNRDKLRVSAKHNT